MFGFGPQQIGQPLSLRQIHPPMFESTTRKLARFGRTKPRDLRQCARDCRYSRPPTVKVELNNIFPSRAVGSGKANDKRSIQICIARA